MNLKKFGLLPWIILAIVLGVICGHWFPLPLVRVFATFNSIFSNFLQFLIPLIIIGLVTPAIADIRKGAGRLLLITVAIAYADTVFSGFLSYGVSSNLFPQLIEPRSVSADELGGADQAAAYFTINIPPMVDVMSALIFSFIVGLGIAAFNAGTLRAVFGEFKNIISGTIQKVLLPLLPLYIFGIFLAMAYSGEAGRVISVFLKIIVVIFVMHVVLLVLQYCIAGALARRNPFKALWNMLPAYLTALGTSSSAATIPVTYESVQKNGVSRETAGFVVPLCATIHLSGSMLKITACAVALMLMQGMPVSIGPFTGFILMLGVMMVAAPGVPGGAIMAALGVLSTMLGFGEQEQALMIALYITMDSFGTACNVTGDGAIAMVVDRIKSKHYSV